MRSRWVGFILAGGVASVVYLVPHDSWTTPDVRLYLRQAMSPFRFTSGPHGFRFLVPLVAWLLPVSAPLGIELVTTAAFAGLAASLRRWWWIFTVPAAWLALRNPRLIDFVAVLFIVLALRLGSKGRSAALVLGVGVCAKEVVAFAVLPLVVYAWLERWSWRRWVPIVVVPAAVLAIVHFTPLLWGYVPAKGPFDMGWSEQERFGGHVRTLVSVAVMYAPSLALVARTWPRLPKFWHVAQLLVIPVALTAAASSDTYRLMMPVAAVTLPTLSYFTPGPAWWVAAVTMPVLVMDGSGAWKVPAELALLTLAVVGLVGIPPRIPPKRRGCTSI